MGSEVRATLTADSSEYTSAFDKARQAHEQFFESERRVTTTIEGISRSMIGAKDPVEALTGSMMHLSRIFGDELSMKIAGGVAVIGLIIAKMVETSEAAKKAQYEISQIGNVDKVGPAITETNATDSNTSAAVGRVYAARNAMIEALEDPSMTARVERGWKRIFSMGRADSEDARNLDDLTQKFNDFDALKAGLSDKATAAMAQAADAKYRGPEEQGAAKKAQIEIDSKQKQTDLDTEHREAEAQSQRRKGIEEEREVDLDTAHAERLQNEDRRHNEETARIVKMKADGDTEVAKKAETVEATQHTTNVGAINGIPDTGQATILNAQVAAQKEIADLAYDHLAAETQIAAITGPRGERAIEAAKAEVVELQRQRDLQVDKNAWMEKNVSLMKAQQALTDQVNAREEEIQKAKAQGTYLDIQYKQEKEGYVGEQTIDQKIELANAKLAEYQRQLQAPDVAGDPNKEAAIENEMKQLRNEIAKPVDRLDFGGTTQLAVGGGMRGTGGDPLLAETQQQTGFLKNIDTQIAALNATLASGLKTGGMTLR